MTDISVTKSGPDHFHFTAITHWVAGLDAKGEPMAPGQ